MCRVCTDLTSHVSGSIHGPYSLTVNEEGKRGGLDHNGTTVGGGRSGVRGASSSVNMIGVQSFNSDILDKRVDLNLFIQSERTRKLHGRHIHNLHELFQSIDDGIRLRE